MDEATSDEADPNNPNASYGYRAVLPPVVDHAMKAQQDAEDAWRKNNPDDPMNGMKFLVEKFERDKTAVDPYQFEGY